MAYHILTQIQLILKNLNLIHYLCISRATIIIEHFYSETQKHASVFSPLMRILTRSCEKSKMSSNLL